MSLLFIDMSIRISLLVASAAMVNRALKSRGSATSRHLVWTAALAALLVFPLVSIVLPGWTIPIRIQAQTRSAKAFALQPVETRSAEAFARRPVETRSADLLRQGSGGQEAVVPHAVETFGETGVASGFSRTSDETAVGSGFSRTLAAFAALYGFGVVLLFVRLIADRWR